MPSEPITSARLEKLASGEWGYADAPIARDYCDVPFVQAMARELLRLRAGGGEPVAWRVHCLTYHAPARTDEIEAQNDATEYDDAARCIECAPHRVRPLVYSAAPTGESCFTCPHCGDPFAWTKEPEPDFHAGATYTCNKCGGEVIFTVETPEQYALPAPTGEGTLREKAMAEWIAMAVDRLECDYGEPPSEAGEGYTVPEALIKTGRRLLATPTGQTPAPRSGADVERKDQ